MGARTFALRSSIHHPESDVVAFALVGSTHARGSAADRAIAEELGVADAQPVIAEAGGDAEGDEVVERIVDDHHQVAAHGQLA